MAWRDYQLKVGPVWCVKQVQHVEQPEDIFFSRHFLCNRSAVDMAVFGYDNVNVPYVVYVFLLFVHVFLLLSMYAYCCLCILRRGYPV